MIKGAIRIEERAERRERNYQINKYLVYMLNNAAFYVSKQKLIWFILLSMDKTIRIKHKSEEGFENRHVLGWALNY